MGSRSYLATLLAFELPGATECRSGEVCGVRLNEMDLAGREWRIPALTTSLALIERDRLQHVRCVSAL